jgi:hypothetical protein
MVIFGLDIVYGVTAFSFGAWGSGPTALSQGWFCNCSNIQSEIYSSQSTWGSNPLAFAVEK